ncbi:MAG TPA: hypothetical protein VF017_00260 [Thermoanaerobaculia bacterium]|nr:hypothetical protein [Thermoanaerobaculia bacterium]
MNKKRRNPSAGGHCVLLAALWGLVLSALPGAAQEVTLPLPDYLDLRSRATASPPPPAPPPVAVSFEAARLDLVVEDGRAHLRQELALVVHADGWQHLALPPAGPLVSAAWGGAQGRLEEVSGGWRLAISGRGRHALVLESILPVFRDTSSTRSRSHLRLDLPAAAVVAGSLTLPESTQGVTAPAQAVLRAAGPRRWSFTGEPGASLTFTFSGEAPVRERSRQPLRFEATSTAALTATPTRRQLEAWVETRVLEGELDRLRLGLPAGFEVIDVAPEGTDWRIDAGELEVVPRAPVSGTFIAHVQLAADAASSFEGTVLWPRGAVRTVAVAKVALAGDGLLEPLDRGTARRPDPRQEQSLPEPFRQAPGEGLLLPTADSPPRWQVTWPEAAEVLAAQVDRLVVEVLVGSGGRAFYQVWAETRSAGVTDLRLTLPAGAALVAASRDGLPIVPGQAGDAWVLPLASLPRAQVLYLAALVPAPASAASRLAIALPQLSAPATRIETRLLLPGGRRYRFTEAGRAGQVMAPPQTAATKEASELAQRLNQALAVKRDERTGFLTPPPGYAVLQASWSALASTLPPLTLETETIVAKEVWQ